MGWIKIRVGNDPHAEVTKTPEVAAKYCKKEESRVAGPWEYGYREFAYYLYDFPRDVGHQGQGKRRDIDELWDKVKLGCRTYELYQENPARSKFDKAIKSMRFVAEEWKSDRQIPGVNVIVLYGDTACGKTYAAINIWGKDGDYFKLDCTGVKGGSLWFDGYEGQRTLIIDDFDDNVCSVGFLKTLLDKYKLRIPVKGTHSWACWTTVVITSNYHPAK